MPDAAWWILHGVQDAALAAAMGLSFSASRRTGAHTPYGQMLFLLATGFWFLLLAEFTFLARNALGLWTGPGGLPDALALPGWMLLAASVTLFVIQFSIQRTLPIPLMAITGMAAALILFWGFLSPPGADPDGAVRAAYIAIDGIAIGVVLGGWDRFRRLRRSALGKLYAFLATALVIKSAGDLFWAYLAARDLVSLYATATYPVAGAMALTGLALHHRDLRRQALEAPIGTPWLNRHQTYLRDAAMQLRDVAGEYAARTFLHAAAGALDERGAAWQLLGMTIDADVDEETWRSAVLRGENFARRHLGLAAQQAFSALEGTR